MHDPCVYILANNENGTLYAGVTEDIERRVEEHKNKINKGFNEDYNINKLVYFEKHISIEDAMLREKQIKKWNRKWKIELIEKNNPEWKDLFDKKLDNLEIVEILSGKKRK